MSNCDHKEDIKDIVDENDKLKATLLKFRDLIEFGPFFDTTATMLVNEADELLNPAASYNPRLRKGRWIPKVECQGQSVQIRALEWEGFQEGSL